MTLFDMIGEGITIVDSNNLLKKEKLSEKPKDKPVGLNTEQARFTHSLIKHLDMLYNSMLAGEITEMSQPVTEIAGMPYTQTRAWYNPGHSSVTESA